MAGLIVSLCNGFGGTDEREEMTKEEALGIDTDLEGDGEEDFYPISAVRG